jgi:hypothetical protein
MDFAEIIYVQKESFFRQALPVFIAALLAFIFSILLFYLTESLKRRNGKRELEENVSREVQFNINFLDKMKIELDRLTQNVSANDVTILPVFKFDKFQRTFLAEAFNKGLLYQKLSDDEINTVDSMFGYFFSTTNEYLARMVVDFRTGDMTAAQMLPVLRYNIDETIKYIDFLKLILPRFKRK